MPNRQVHDFLAWMDFSSGLTSKQATRIVNCYSYFFSLFRVSTSTFFLTYMGCPIFLASFIILGRHLPFQMAD